MVQTHASILPPSVSPFLREASELALRFYEGTGLGEGA